MTDAVSNLPDNLPAALSGATGGPAFSPALPAKKVKPLSSRRLRFIKAYIAGRSGKDAAIRAGFSSKSAGQKAYTLLRDPDVLSALAEEAKKSGLTLAHIYNDLEEMIDQCKARLPDAETATDFAAIMRALTQVQTLKARVLGHDNAVSTAIQVNVSYEDRLRELE